MSVAPSIPSDEVKVPLSLGELSALHGRSGLGAWFLAIRQCAFDRLGEVPFPTESHELWRYTSPDLFDFDSVPAAVGSPVSLVDYESGEPYPGADVSVTSGASISSDDQLLVASLLGTGEETSAPALLQLACVGSVTVVRVARNAVVERPILLRHDLSGGGVIGSLVVVVAEPGSQATFVEDLSDSFEGFLLPRVELVVRDNASLSFSSLQRLERKGKLFATHRAHLSRDSRTHLFHLGLGAGVSRIDLDCRLLEPGASADMDSLLLGDGERHVDLHGTQEHLAPNCRSDLFCKAALRGRARSVYYGYIKVADGAQKTDAYQTNRNLVLSPEARADSIPNLEIKANDVKCSHGSSVGQVSQDELFYLRSRGLTTAQAEKLLVEGFFADVLAKAPFRALGERMYDLVMERLKD